MSLAMKARQKVKRKGAAKDRVFGCDLVEHLQLSNQDVPQVLKSCTEFVELHGIVDGIYRLSGVSSNIQRLRSEFDTDRKPDLNKAVYLQDIHCVSSLCKAYFRELPNPLLTYQLYDKFADAVAIQLEEARLDKIKEVLKELPAPHYRTLEFLMKHLVHMASFSAQTNMHIRNLAIVWAPNLLRSKDIETSGFNGTAAFMEVRIQSIVVEFILTHVDQIFENAPLRTSSRESLRKSLLLMGSPVTFVDDKYSFSCNIPTVLNQGDGPPQMRPYHTIIELADGKRKGSLKAKKWRSIFNLGRSGNDSKRKLLKAEDKEKENKMRLRPAKSMDSLSSVPCDDDVRLGRKKSQKLSQCRESFDGPVSLDSSFLVSDEYSPKTKAEEMQGESEGEASAKSEPTTPKTSRSSLVGAAPQGRSPKATQNRAEKCVGVRISGPFSVTVPFHITSNLTLSRLTRGLECPALTHYAMEKDIPEDLEGKENEALKSKDTAEGLKPGDAVGYKESAKADTKMENLSDSEENRISMEVQDSFSFLDSQDAWLGESLDGEQSRKSSIAAPEFTGRDAERLTTTEDESGSGLMNEMMGGDMQLEMFSSHPPLDYLSIEECMNELSEDEDDQYYLAMGFEDREELPKEADTDEVYLSAFDDLSPLATELKHLQLPSEDQRPDTCLPRNVLEEQPFSLVGRVCPGDPADMDPFLASLSSCDPGLSDSSYTPEISDLLEVRSIPNAGGNLGELETPIQDEAEATQIDSSSSLLQEDGANTGGAKNLLPETEVLVATKCPGRIPENLPKCSVVPEYLTQPSLENEWNFSTQNILEIEQDPWPPCLLRPEPDGTIPGGDGVLRDYVACGFPFPEEEELLSREPFSYSPTAESPLSLEGPMSLRAPLSSLLDNHSHKDSAESTPGFPPPPSLDFDQSAPSGTAPPSSPSSDHCLETDTMQFEEPFPLGGLESLQPGLQQTSLVEIPDASKHDLPDGSVHMKLTSSTVRVQQVKSFPVIPPKPQFAKIPPSLEPITSAKEASPNLPAPDKGSGSGMKAESSEGPVQPTNLDRAPSDTASAPDVEIPSASSEQPTSLGNCHSNLGILQKQRNSMPASLENYSQDCESRDVIQNTPQSLQNKYSLSSKTSEFSHRDLEHAKVSLGVALDNHSDTRNQPPGPVLQEKHPSEVMPQKQKRTTWRNGGSMSFDEAVALAKERHVAQAPVRRMQTYCCGDAEGHPGPCKTEKPPPNLKPALKVLGQQPLRPLSCLGAAAFPEALASGKSLPAQTQDTSPEGQLSPNKEASFPLQDLSPRKRLSLEKIGRRFSTSDEAPCTASEWR